MHDTLYNQIIQANWISFLFKVRKHRPFHSSLNFKAILIFFSKSVCIFKGSWYNPLTTRHRLIKSKCRYIKLVIRRSFPKVIQWQNGALALRIFSKMYNEWQDTCTSFWQVNFSCQRFQESKCKANMIKKISKIQYSNNITWYILITKPWITTWSLSYYLVYIYIVSVHWQTFQGLFSHNRLKMNWLSSIMYSLIRMKEFWIFFSSHDTYIFSDKTHATYQFS